jgi:chromosome segregation protein
MIRLKALDLFGFKSFADRTRFEFPAGITVVVGPNGSGKSNVVDAIKWVLGEQSMRSLRGRTATDVIFAGSPSRKPLNVAEVALVFDNASRLLPVESDEVQIARRVYRSGESEYLVNGAVSRLRDIRELFSGTGAATEAYSVIEQGRVDALLVASGRDRRLVFEEAAGITRFRARRGEALRRLERAEQNRQRLADIVGEVSSRLETVTQQAKRARRWRTMTDTLRALRVAASSQDLRAAEGILTGIEAALAEARGDQAEAEGRAASAATRVENLSERERGLLPLLAERQAAIAREREKAAAAAARLELLRARRMELATELEGGEAALRAARAAARGIDSQTAAARADLAAALDEAERISALQRTCEEAAAGSFHDATALRRALDDRTDALAAMQRARSAAQSAVDREAARAAEARQAVDSWRSRLDAAQAAVARAGESAATWEGNLATLAKGLDDVTWELEALETTQRELAATLDEAWRTLASWEAKQEACGERRAILGELIERHEGFSDAARRLLAVGRHVPGLAGPLADLIDADEPWATIVDLALGGRGHSLVVESIDGLLANQADWTAAEPVREALAAGGRVVFVASACVPEPPPLETDLPGVVGRLDRLVDAAAPAASTLHEEVRRKLLGRTWVVESLETAARLVGRAPEGVVAITRSGEMLASGGTCEMGGTGASSGHVARRSEWRSLDERFQELARTVTERRATIDTLQAEQAAVQQRVRQAITRRQQAAEQMAASRTELGRACREQESARAAITAAESGLREAERQAITVGLARDEAAATLALRDADIEAGQSALAAARADLDLLDHSRGRAAEEINRLRAERSACEPRVAAARAAVNETLGAAAIGAAEIEAATRRRADADARLAAIELDLLSATSAFAETMVTADTAHAALAAITADRDAIRAALDKEETEAIRAREEALALASRIHALDLEAGEARHARSRVIERIRDDYGIEIGEQSDAAPPVDGDGAAIDVPTDRIELDRQIDDLRRKLAAMTTVNMEALAEAEALGERLVALETQLADVTGGKQAIEQLIARIDDESRRLLAETIETVRGHFRELFERVFGGGEADIVLEPGVDLLETSVEIVARPPGKEPRSISLLSGGEKTMTCVALLLAIFRSRPSPFCVLDEVDAALDEANVDRFVGVLRDFLSSTQFIVVTHSKKTMAAANTLYGVTMEESGVSKRVSVRFEATAGTLGKTTAKAA